MSIIGMPTNPDASGMSVVSVNFPGGEPSRKKRDDL